MYKYLLLSLSLLLFPPALFAQQRTNNEEMARADRFFPTVFATLARLARENLPQARNAACAQFRDAVSQNLFLMTVATSPQETAASPGDRLWHPIRQKFYDGFYTSGFKENPNYLGTMQASHKIRFGIACEVEFLAQQSVDAIAPMISSPEQKQAIFHRLRKSALRSYVIIANSKVAIQGTYPNGHIAGEVNKAAVAALEELEKNSPETRDPVVVSVRNTLRLLRDLDTDGHAPWLSAWWQLQFQIICQAWEYL